MPIPPPLESGSSLGINFTGMETYPKKDFINNPTYVILKKDEDIDVYYIFGKEDIFKAMLIDFLKQLKQADGDLAVC